jgi:hypothetical protein
MCSCKVQSLRTIDEVEIDKSLAESVFEEGLHYLFEEGLIVLG